MKVKYKRLIAYLIDITLVTFVIGIISNTNFMQNQMDKYNDANTRLEEYTVKVLEESNFNEETEKDLKSLIYDINSFGSAYNILNITITIGYFAIFQYFNKGQTIGKKILKIKTISNNDEELSFISYILRALVLYGIIFTIINMVSIQYLGVNNFYKVYSISNCISSLISLIIFFMVLFRKDERGLHDIISSSKVIEDQQ